VYLRRRSARGFVPPPPSLVAAGGGSGDDDAAAAAAAAVEMDDRDHVTMAFSLRLCGAPGAVTSNSIAGRSTAGKPFGVSDSSSWGWENFLSAGTLTDRATWSSGPALRFVVTLDMV
jgi:hypothetical protein